MRRLFAILLMLIVPLQFGWSAALNIHGHSHGDIVLGFHTHDDHHGSLGDHQHTHPGEAPSGETDVGFGQAVESTDGADKGDGDRPDGHYHPILASLVMHIALPLDLAATTGAPSRPPDTFSSRIPPLFDWPPARG
jgi:hypothetical protein